MSLRVTLPEKGSMPFIVPDSAEALIRDVHVLWRSPEDQLLVKIEKINDDGSEIESISIEDTIRNMLRKSITAGKTYLKKRKFQAEEIPEEIKVKSAVNKNIQYQYLNAENKLILQKVTEDKFLDLLQKYNPK